jgi:hypothetical protein
LSTWAPEELEQQKGMSQQLDIEKKLLELIKIKEQQKLSLNKGTNQSLF